MGCFSGRLMSAASDQKLFCKLCSPYCCSFNEFVEEKVISPSYSSAILTLLSHFEKMSALLACTSLLSQLLKRFKYVIVNNTGDVLAAVARFSSFYWAPDDTGRSKHVNVPPARCLLSLRSDRERQLSAAPQRLLCYTCLDCERYVLVTNTPSVEKFCLKTLNKNRLAQCFCQFWIHNIIFVSNFKLFNVLPSLCLAGW